MGSFRGSHFCTPSFLGEYKMKKIFCDNNYTVYLVHFFGGDLVVVHDYKKTEKVYTFASAKEKGIIQNSKGKLMCVMPSGTPGILTVSYF